MQEHIITPYRADPAWLVTATSFLIDRAVPECERIHLPAREVPGGILQYGYGLLPAPPEPRRRFSALRGGRRPAPMQAPQREIFDLRRNTPTNWAHFLDNHLPIVFTICDRLEIDPRAALLVLPEETPGYIAGAAAMLGLQTLQTDAPLTGTGVLYEATPWTCIRPQRHVWVDTETVRDSLARIDATAAAEAPRRVFLSRRNNRAPSNEDEIMEWLGPQGFVKICPEDLSPEQQMRLFRQTEEMVAVHGAGLGPLLYTERGGRLRKLVEILHAGHMTDVYRVMAHQVGVQWIGVRGRLKPEYIRDAYDLGSIYKAHSLDNFEVDVAALETAFEMAGMG